MDTELLNFIGEAGCMYHKDEGKCPVWPSAAYYRVEGDVWCAEGLVEFLFDGCKIEAEKIEV
jgi:hypothetical protein